MASKMEKAKEIIKEKQIIRPKDFDEFNIPRRYLTRLYQRGLVRRIDRGLYEYIDRQPTEKATIVEVCKKIPNGIVCLLSALQIHDITTQQPREVWIALEHSARRPKTGRLPVRIVHMTGNALEEGISVARFENVQVRVYNPAKTVADCFKFRNKIGLDVALEALREVRRKKLVTSEELWHYAKICRVSKIMRPYLESIQ